MSKISFFGLDIGFICRKSIYSEMKQKKILPVSIPEALKRYF